MSWIKFVNLGQRSKKKRCGVIKYVLYYSLRFGASAQFFSILTTHLEIIFLLDPSSSSYLTLSSLCDSSNHQQRPSLPLPADFTLLYHSAQRALISCGIRSQWKQSSVVEGRHNGRRISIKSSRWLFLQCTPATPQTQECTTHLVCKYSLCMHTCICICHCCLHTAGILQQPGKIVI